MFYFIHAFPSAIFTKPSLFIFWSFFMFRSLKLLINPVLFKPSKRSYPYNVCCFNSWYLFNFLFLVHFSSWFCLAHFYFVLASSSFLCLYLFCLDLTTSDDLTFIQITLVNVYDATKQYTECFVTFVFCLIVLLSKEEVTCIMPPDSLEILTVFFSR